MYRFVNARRIALCTGAMVVCAIAVVMTRAPRLPRVKLADGGEFRVLQINYGTEHRLAAAPRPIQWMWEQLPSFVQARIPQPSLGADGLGSDKVALSIWRAWFDPATGKPEIGPSDNAVMTLDEGERINLDWPDPSDSCRQIFVIDPPNYSRRLRFHVVVNEERVDFTIANPAFRKERRARKRRYSK